MAFYSLSASEMWPDWWSLVGVAL